MLTVTPPLRVGVPDAASFDVASTSSQLLTYADLDYEERNSYEAMVIATSMSDSATVAIAIEVMDAEEIGAVSLSPTDLRVRTVVRATSADPYGDVGGVPWPDCTFDSSHMDVRVHRSGRRSARFQLGY